MRKRPKSKIFEIKVLNAPKEDIQSQMYWLSETLGLFSKRDSDGNCYKVFLELLKEKEPIKAEELAKRVSISRPTIIFYLNKLIAKGLIDVKNHSYILKEKNLTLLIENMKKELDYVMSNAIYISKEIDYKINKI